MNMGQRISRLRNQVKMTQAEFAEAFGVSQQSVQKWESGLSVPELDKLILISKYFDYSLDALILGNDNRVVEEMGKAHDLKPQHQNMHDWELYSSNLLTEYRQSVEEGLDIEKYNDVFASVARLPKSEIKKQLGDILFEVVISARISDRVKMTLEHIAESV